MNTTDKSKPGVKAGTVFKDETEKVFNLGICGTQEDLDFMLTWCQTGVRGAKNVAFSRMLVDLRKYKPKGFGTSPRPDPGAKLQPGTKTTLKKRIAQLEAQLKKAGIEPAE